MGTATIKLIVREYSEYPGPRYCDQGDCSGEDFYHTILNTAFAESYKKNQKLLIDLDGTAGYASSFLDEAFGNLVYDFSLENVKTKIEIISNQEPDWIDMITNDVFIDWEERRKNKEAPKKTVDHPAWYRIQDKELIKEKWK
ncbi:MAG: STAS-like domain-containing protein [Ginsengibacter sp.]